MDRSQLASIIDHTLLKPEATVAEVEALCAEATALGVAAVCVSPTMLPLTAPPPPTIDIATVIGFPGGNDSTEAKVAEATQAVADGATELDMVIALDALKAQEWAAVGADIAAVVAVAGIGHPVKVILETAILTDDEITLACAAAESSGASYVKTSTGFHPAGGATEAAVHLMARTVGGRLGVKASGGIRDTATALRMVNAGATRLGCSATKAILDGL
jgi:deoxyribose-phosphate aldolase